MRTSSCDEACLDKASRRRQQKRDYATRKRRQEKDRLRSLEREHLELRSRSMRQKRQIEQLKTWAKYAKSYLSLCAQLVALQSSQQRSTAHLEHAPDEPQLLHPGEGPNPQSNETPAPEGAGRSARESGGFQDSHCPRGSGFLRKASRLQPDEVQGVGYQNGPGLPSSPVSQPRGACELPARETVPEQPTSSGCWSNGMMDFTVTSPPSSVQNSVPYQPPFARSSSPIIIDSSDEDPCRAEDSPVDTDLSAAGSMMALLLADTPCNYTDHGLDLDCSASQDIHQLVMVSSFHMDTMTSSLKKTETVCN